MSLARALWSWTPPALLGLFGALVLLAAPLRSLLPPTDGGVARDWAVALSVAWGVLTVGGAVASRLFAQGREIRLLEKFSGAVSTVLLVAVLGILGRGVLAFAPTGSDTAVARLLDRALGPAWAVIGGVCARVGLPADLAGVPTPPLALLAMLFLGRNTISWHIDKLRRGDYRGRTPLPSGAGSPLPTSDEARERARAAERRIAVPSSAEAKPLPTATSREPAPVCLDVVGSTAHAVDVSEQLKRQEDADTPRTSGALDTRLVDRSSFAATGKEVHGRTVYACTTEA